MSGAIYWLQRQRKAELAALADHAGLKDYENLLKSDLEVALEEHLRANESRLKKDAAFEPFYRRIVSPVKRESTSALTTMEDTKKPRARRQTKAREEFEPPSDSEPFALATRTPRTTLSFAQTIPLPPSPSALVDKIESQTSTISTSVSSYISSSPLPSSLNTLRTALSSVISIELLVLVIEAWGLRAQVLPLRYLTTLPAVPAFGTGELAIKIPDLFALLTLGFWGPVSLWVLTSVILPLVGAWFVNLTEGGKLYDPLSFNVVKGLVAWVVYVKGGVGGESTVLVEQSVPGGSQGLLVGAGIGILASLYEAVLKR